MEQDEIEAIKRRAKELRDKISSARKKGTDTRIIDIKMLGIAPKIQLADATKQKKDIDKANQAMDAIEKEVNELKTQN
ncbi:hypothetical protein HY640_03375 [Candidatus Woesearchaeota archaeon]|nr:hypothetical protein [Candidatus Woesearchaeota archaeon]